MRERDAAFSQPLSVEASPYGRELEQRVSDSKKIDPVAPAGAARGVNPVGRAAPVTPLEAASPVAPVGRAGALVAALGARLQSGELDRPAAVRAFVAEVVGREFDALDPDTRARMIDEVIEVLGEEPAWRTRFDALWSDTPR